MQTLLIGTGYLAEYLIPCYEKCLGDDLADHMIGIKGSEANLAKRQEVFPFPIQVLGTEEVLRERKPDLILMAAKPNQVPGIVEETLAAYYEEVRAAGEKLPVLYSFAPAPSVGWLTDVLGEDVLVCNMLPSMLREIAGVNTAEAGFSYLSFDERAPWSEEEKAAAVSFLRPTGQVLEIPGDQAAAFLGIHEGTHVVYEFSAICCDGLKERGEEISIAAAAGAFRRALRDAIKREYPTPIPIAQGMKEEHYPFWKNLIYSYLGGILEYAGEVGIDPEKAILKVAASMEMNSMFVQNATPEKMRQAIASHATKGGVLEKQNASFAELGFDKLKEAWGAYLDGEMDEWAESSFDDEMADIAYEIAGIVSRHTAGLAGV